MATPVDLDTIARALPGVTVGKYWDDPAAYLMEGKGVRGGRGLAHHRSPRRDEGTFDPATGEPFTDLVVVQTATPEARDRARPAMLALGVTVFPFNTHLAFYSTFWGIATK